jgi:hypothetical protein
MNTNSHIMDGTSIKDLQYNSSDIRDIRDNVRSARHHDEQHHDEQYDSQYNQHNQQNPHTQHAQHNHENRSSKNNEQIDIDELARDISDNLNGKESFEQENENEDIEIEKENLTFSIPYNLKDPLILLIIYFILSQSSVRQLFGKYISFINPNEEGIVSQLGVIIYGIIFIMIFMVIKKFL